MSLDVLILLFVLFSAVSSIVNKLQQRSADNKREQERRQQPASPDPDDEEDEFDLSEWDVFREPEPRPQPQPTVEREVPAPTPSVREFREVRGTRTVEEPRGRSEEFREVEATRDVEEPKGVPEFREVTWAQPTTEAPGELRIPEVKRPKLKAPRRRPRKVRLNLGPQAVRKGILYREILGPPRGLKPWGEE